MNKINSVNSTAYVYSPTEMGFGEYSNTLLYKIGPTEISEFFLYALLHKAFKGTRVGLPWGDIREVNHGQADPNCEDFAVIVKRGSVRIMDKNDFADYILTFSSLQNGLQKWHNAFNDDTKVIDLKEVTPTDANEVIQYAVFGEVKYNKKA